MNPVPLFPFGKFKGRLLDEVIHLPDPGYWAWVLTQPFLWKDYPASEQVTNDRRDDVADEIADVAIYLFELADNLGIVLGEAVATKMAKNALKYPVEKARGSNKKYNEF